MNIGLNINYNEAENSAKIIETFCGFPIDVAKILIPTLISLIIFTLGIILNIYIKKREKRNDLISFRTAIISWGDLIQNPVIDFALSCRQFANNILKSRNMISEPIGFHVMQSHNLYNIEIKKYIETFVTNYNGDLVKNAEDLFLLTSNFTLIHRLQEDIEKQYFVYQKKTQELEEHWFNLTLELENLTDKYIREIGKDAKSKDFPLLQEVRKIDVEYKLKHPKNIYSMRINYLEKIDAACVSALNRDFSNEYALQYIQIFRKMHRVFIAWKANNDATRFQYLSYATTLMTSRRTIKKMLSNFCKNNLKPIWKIH